MPSIDDQLRTRMREAAPRPAGADDLVERLGARKRRRASLRRVGSVGLVAIVLLATAGTFFALGRAFRTAPIPAITPTQPIENLGLNFAICRVMSMPMTVAGVQGNAYVFTRATDGCPQPGEGTRFVAADLNGDGVVETPPVKLDGCFPPVGCETFAAPDVNGDGTSEIAVSNAGADGYGVWLFAVTSSPPAVEPITVVDPQGLGNVQTGLLQFGWADVVGHAEGARCDSSPSGTTLTIFGYDKFDPRTEVRTTTLRIDDATATVIGASNDRMPLAEAPVPGNEICGAPLHGSAANFPHATNASGTDIGISTALCNVSELSADFTGDGNPDTAWVGTPARGGRCTNPAETSGVAAIDYTGDGLADGSYSALPGCVDCRAYATVDLNADGRSEFVALIQSSSTPVYEIFEGLQSNTESPGLVPLVVSVGNAANGFPADGSPLMITAGGDEGSRFAVRCEGFPTDPVLVLWRSYHPIEGPGSSVRDIYETKFKLLATGTFAVVDARHYTQPTSNPLPFSLMSKACGVDWFLPA
jgi:hypothetical protein